MCCTTTLTARLDPPQMVPDRLGGVISLADFRDAPTWLREAYPEMFAYASLRDRLALCALVLRSRELSANPGRCQEVVDAALEWANGFEPLLTR